MMHRRILLTRRRRSLNCEGSTPSRQRYRHPLKPNKWTRNRSPTVMCAFRKAPELKVSHRTTFMCTNWENVWRRMVSIVRARCGDCGWYDDDRASVFCAHRFLWLVFEVCIRFELRAPTRTYLPLQRWQPAEASGVSLRGATRYIDAYQKLWIPSLLVVCIINY